MSAPTTEERRGDGWGWESLEDEAAEMRAIAFWKTHGDTVEELASIWRPSYPEKSEAFRSKEAEILEIHGSFLGYEIVNAADAEIEADLANQVYCLQHPDSDTCPR